MSKQTHRNATGDGLHARPPFRIQYWAANPRRGACCGRDRITSSKVVEAYAKGLEDAHRHLTGTWGRKCQKGEIDVKILDVGRELLRPTVGLTYSPSADDPPLRIALAAAPSGTLPSEICPFGALLADDLRIARSVAIHECVHLFNLHRFPLHDYSDTRWEQWCIMDEGTALFHDWELCGHRGNWLGLARGWVIHPERGLAQDGTGCSAAFLLDALTTDYPTLPGDLWNEDPLPESGLHAVSQYLQECGVLFAHPRQLDFFGSVFCPDAWCGRSARKGSMCQTAWRRYGERSLSWSWDLEDGEEHTHEDSLPSLACRYYRAWGVKGLSSVQVRLEPRPGSAGVLKAVVRQLGRTGKEVGQLETLPTDESGSINSAVVPHRDGHSLLLTVTHCGWQTPEQQRPVDYQITWTT